MEQGLHAVAEPPSLTMLQKAKVLQIFVYLREEIILTVTNIALYIVDSGMLAYNYNLPSQIRNLCFAMPFLLYVLHSSGY